MMVANKDNKVRGTIPGLSLDGAKLPCCFGSQCPQDLFMAGELKLDEPRPDVGVIW